MSRKVAKRLACGTILVGLTLFLLGGAALAKESLRLAATTHPDHVYTQTAFKFGEILTQKTKGEIEVKVYPSRQLGNEREQMEMVGLGTIAFALPPVGLVSNMAPELAALQLPFLYDNAEVLSRALKLPVMDKLKATLEPKGIKSLCIGSSGLRLLMLRDKKVTSLSDMKGLKLRTLQAPIYMETVKAIGASPAPLPYGEVYTALQQGVIDGTLFDIGAVLLFGFPEIAKKYTRIGYMDLPFMIIMNKGLFDKYPAATQKAILEAGNEARDYNIARLQEFDQTADAKLKELGCEVFKVTDLPAFKEKVKPIIKEYSQKYPVVAEYVKAVEELNDKYGQK